MKFSIVKIYDGSRDENYYQVEFGETGEILTSDVGFMLKEIERISKDRNEPAVIEYDPREVIAVDLPGDLGKYKATKRVRRTA